MNPVINSILHALLWPIIIAIVLGLAGLTLYFAGYVSGKKDRNNFYKRSKKYTRSILGGLFSEQVAPFLSDFPKDLKASEARFVGKPVDFLIFKGMDEGDINEVVFVEVKTGNSQLTPNERKLKDVINAKQVRWIEYRVNGQVSTLQEV
jgi:predicted Holliday junction resolvase-like endonuclease